jgi:hypothetical protein
MSTISTTITTGVQIGSAAYPSPLTITSAGYVVTGPTAGTPISGIYGTLVNDGRITETNPTRSNYGVYFRLFSSVFNAGAISAAAEGINLVAGGYLYNAGTLSAGNGVALLAEDLSTVINTGSVEGSTGIVLQGGGSIDNSGTIRGQAGIGVSYATGTVTNTGLITGSMGNGIAMLAGGGVTNTASGAIYGGGGYAGLSIGGGAGSVVNSGTINGYAGVVFSGAYNDTLIDSGTIIGRAGTAVALGTGTGLMQLQPGTLLIQGIVDGGGGANTLEFAAGAGTLTGEGADFVNFGQATIDAGAQWSIDGNVTLGAGIDLTISGTLSVAGTLENAGSISPVSYAGLQIAAGGYLLNDASGVIVNNITTDGFDPTVRAAYASDVTVVNFGAIENPAGGVPIYLMGGGTVVNGSATDTSALISGPLGVYAKRGPAAITNFGSIIGSGSGNSGVLLTQGVVTNGAAGSTSALLQGSEYGVLMVNGAGTVVNFGTISSGYSAINMRGSGGTVVDSGVIAGSKAISFGGNDNLLVLEHGFTITGAIAASGSGNVVELQGSAGAAVAATYNTLGLSGFQTAAFAPSDGNYATWTITNNAQLPGTIAGFKGIHDAIDLTTLSDVNKDATTSFNTLTDVLTVTGDNGSVRLQLDNEDYAGTVWTVQNDGSNGTEVTPLCFCAGTYLTTPAGEELVERLKAGDLVLTASGEVRAITWIGTGRVLATRGRRNAATPVIVRKGAIAPNVPHSDLHVTKGHSFYLDGVLVPIEFLVNHRTILWDDHAQEVTLYHIELETHDVLVANGAPAESYRDDGNRWLFQNANAGWGQPPKSPCAEVVTGGPIVDAIWRRLLDRAGSRSQQVLTDDPDLHLLVGGRRLDAEQQADSAYVFNLPPAARSVRIASRAAAPAELGLARDPRVLGVAVKRIVVRAGSKFRVIDLTDDRLAEGFHGYEPAGGLRWTDGDAALPVTLFDGLVGPTELVLHVDGTTQYRADDRSGQAAA